MSKKATKLPIPEPLFDSLANMLANPNFVPSNMQHPQDYAFGKSFLLSYRGSEATFNAYRREIERLLQWAWLIQSRSLLSLTRADIEQYLEFCQAPPKAWIGTKNVPRFIQKNGTSVANPEWRPFVVSVSKAEFKNGVAPQVAQYSLSERAIRELLAIDSSFFNFLMQEGHLEANPISQLRQKSKFIRKKQSTTVIRRLSDLQWSYVIETAEIMAAEKPAAHERTLFIMTALYAMYLRISELTASQRWIPKMRDFHQDLDGNWWFTTVGKGNKERAISVSNKMLEALQRYRTSLNLTPLPSPSDMRPLLLRNKGSGAISSTRQIRAITQSCFDRAILRMHENGHGQDAEQLQSATAHWLRHTGISDDVKIRPREHVRDDAGHSSSAITDKYIDIELRARHASAKNKPIKPFEVEQE
ncbi:MAG TPA: tyrosine-type recombinase/integrase [Gammaproteobacteria bacterium]|nr:tyrosine-type recombinase/integrase [Gammaproteobacteria bacterium]